MTTYERTPQIPLPSGFGPETTAREAIAGKRLDGTVAIVSGGYAGIGLETTRTFVEAGATVIVPARTPDKAQKAVKGIEGIEGAGKVELEALDLMDPASIDAFAARFLAKDRPLHLLVNNAGIMASPLERDARGFESQLSTNHLGHFQLTVRLWPALVRARGARVVALSSRGHMRSRFDFEDPNFERRAYEKWSAYGQAKTANVLFAVGLDVRGADHGVRAFAVHPGPILTDLMRSLSEEEVQAVLERAARLTPMKNTQQGAATSVWCATSPKLEGKGGVYCEDADVAEVVSGDEPGPRGVRPWAIDPDLAERLWKKSEEWTGAALR